MLLDKLIENDLVHFEQSFDTWQDAIRGNAKQMIANGYIEDKYVDAVISCVEKYGPYIVIIPNVAMPHSTEGAPGVLKTGIGFMKVAEDVTFESEDGPKTAKLFFMLASSDHEEHLTNMMALSEMLMCDELLEELLEVKNIDEVKALAVKYANVGEEE